MNTREQIDRVLFRSGASNYGIAIDMLTPLVDRLAAERAADELEKAAEEYALRHRKHRHPLETRDWLRARAAALRNQTTEETP